jgi:phosphotransacetylase
MGMIRSFDDLLVEAAQVPVLRVAIVGATDTSVLAGMMEAVQAGIIDPVLVGAEAAVRACVEEVPGAEEFPIVGAATEEAAADLGVAMVARGDVHGLVKGHVHTATFMHPVVQKLRTSRRVSHVFIVELATYPKLLMISDAAVNIAPDLTTKAAIVSNAVDLARTFGVDEPKVAALSSMETVNPAVPSTIDAACLAKMAERGQIRHAIVDGPLAFDGAISAESTSMKGFVSPVSGDVDILLAPDLDAGNILVKDLEYLANAALAGIVIGASAPVVLTSRADPPRSRLLSCAVAAVLAARLPELDGETA